MTWILGKTGFCLLVRRWCLFLFYQTSLNTTVQVEITTAFSTTANRPANQHYRNNIVWTDDELQWNTAMKTMPFLFCVFEHHNIINWRFKGEFRCNTVKFGNKHRNTWIFFLISPSSDNRHTSTKLDQITE